MKIQIVPRKRMRCLSVARNNDRRWKRTTYQRQQFTLAFDDHARCFSDDFSVNRAKQDDVPQTLILPDQDPLASQTLAVPGGKG